MSPELLYCTVLDCKGVPIKLPVSVALLQGFGVFSKDILACGQEELGIKPTTSSFMDNCLTSSPTSSHKTI